MNQSILFSDQVSWNEKDQVLVFRAQNMGLVIECCIHRKILEQYAQQIISSTEDVFFAFERCRFELEEIAENKIKEEEFNSFGQIIISDYE